MFGFFKKKPKVEIHEINICECHNDDAEKMLTEMLFHVISPYVKRISDKLFEYKNASEEEQEKALKEFDALIKDDNDFSPWHIAALIYREIIFKDNKEEKKTEPAKKKQTSRSGKTKFTESKSKSTKKKNK